MVFSIFRVVQPSPPSTFRTFSSPAKRTENPLAVTPLPLLGGQPRIYFLSLQICLWWTLHINGITLPFSCSHLLSPTCKRWVIPELIPSPCLSHLNSLLQPHEVSALMNPLKSPAWRKGVHSNNPGRSAEGLPWAKDTEDTEKDREEKWRRENKLLLVTEQIQNMRQLDMSTKTPHSLMSWQSATAGKENTGKGVMGRKRASVSDALSSRCLWG